MAGNGASAARFSKTSTTGNELESEDLGVSLGSVFKNSVNFRKHCNLLETEKKIKVAKRIKSVIYKELWKM